MTSWWVGKPPQGFTARALEELERMQLSPDSKVSGFAVPIGEGTHRGTRYLPRPTQRRGYTPEDFDAA
jgi:hypothetical protein